MRVIAIFAALLAVAYAAPSALEARQQGEGCKLIHGDSCASHGLKQCGPSSGNVKACCKRCY